jgi:proline dehydrogenase
VRSLLKRIVLVLWRPIERRAAGAYLAGPQLSDAIEAGGRITELGYGLTLGFWNPDDADPGDVAKENLSLIETLRGRDWDWYLSIKVPALGFSSRLVAEIVRASGQLGTIVNLDSHDPDTADSTLALAIEARAIHDRIGITIPGRWRRSLTDADLAVERGLRVRLVKGEWPDPEDSQIGAREGFLAVVDRLAGRAAHVSVATHDADLAREAVRRLAAGGTSHDIELLVGLPFDPVVDVAREAGLPVRVYVPYGRASLRYGLAYLGRNPRRVWWLARDLVLRRRRRRLPRAPIAGRAGS